MGLLHRAARFWSKHVELWLLRLWLLVAGAAVLLVLLHVVHLFAVDRVHVEVGCLSVEDLRRLEAQFARPASPVPAAASGNATARQAMLERFSPVVLLHPDERYFPTTVEFFVKSSSLTVYRQEVLGVGLVNFTALYGWMARVGDTPVDEPTAAALRLVPGEPSWGGETPQGNLSDVPVLGEARLVCRPPCAPDCDQCVDTYDGSVALPSRLYELRFAFLYNYNGADLLVWFIPVGAHLGDLEHVTLRVQEDMVTPIGVCYGAHTRAEARWYGPAAVQWVGGSHPVVFSAVNSHASYPYCGTIRRRGLARLLFPRDHTGSGGRVWWPSAVANINDSSSAAGTLFGQFLGQWGSEPVYPFTRQGWYSREFSYGLLEVPYV